MPRRRELLGFGHQGGKRWQLLRSLVHTHQGHQRTALPLLKARALGGGGVIGQLHADKHKQQALGLGLQPRGVQQIVKAGDVHGWSL